MQRRYPRYGRFIGTGAVAGLLLAFVLALVKGGEEYSAWSVFGYIGLLCGVIGAILGGGVAVLLDGSRKGGS